MHTSRLKEDEITVILVPVVGREMKVKVAVALGRVHRSGAGGWAGRRDVRGGAKADGKQSFIL